MTTLQPQLWSLTLLRTHSCSNSHTLMWLLCALFGLCCQAEEVEVEDEASLLPNIGGEGGYFDHDEVGT